MVDVVFDQRREGQPQSSVPGVLGPVVAGQPGYGKGVGSRPGTVVVGGLDVSVVEGVTSTVVGLAEVQPGGNAPRRVTAKRYHVGPRVDAFEDRPDVTGHGPVVVVQPADVPAGGSFQRLPHALPVGEGCVGEDEVLDPRGSARVVDLPGDLFPQTFQSVGPVGQVECDDGQIVHEGFTFVGGLRITNRVSVSSPSPTLSPKNS
jgi:hypothetical protein